MSDMRIDYPGLMKERLPSGAFRYRVRMEGNKARKTTLNVDPSHPKFREHYHAARAGIQLPPEEVAPTNIRGSVGWLIDEFSAWMDEQERVAQLHRSTVHQRKTFLTWMRGEVGEFNANMPAAELIKLRDKRTSTPGAADNFIKTVRAMYAWGMDRHVFIKANPAAGLRKINDGAGAMPWSVDDLKRYRDRHPSGTMAHAALSLYMFTACRISDVVLLGRGHEFQRDGALWLGWLPEKKGSTRVEIPIVPPLLAAIRAPTVQGPTYLLTQHGKPFASAKAFANRFGTWCEQAGLSGLSSHGIRKSAGELMALQGASQYHIMAIHGHASARTSEVYTRGAERAQLAHQAMQIMAKLDW